jgi:hypothetical protein
MQIQVNTDRNIHGHEALVIRVTEAVEYSLRRFADHITRIEVHLSDEDGAGKIGPHSKRCLIEARLEGRKPVAAADTAITLEQATLGAVDKLSRRIESDLGRVTRDNHQKPVVDDVDAS